jgi:hypothetical protein
MSIKLINNKAVKQKAIEYGMLIRNEKIRTNDEFLADIEELLDAVIFFAIKEQDDIGKKTMARSEWSARQLNTVTDQKRKYSNMRSK